MNHFGFALLTSLLTTAAFAEPVVLYKSDDARPMSDYLELPDYTELQKAVEQAASTFNPAAVAQNLLAPIRTPELAVGKIQPETLTPPKTVPQPFFLVGSDNVSQQWLSKNKEYLQKKGFVGFLIQAETMTDIQTMRGLAQGLSLTPLSGSQIAKDFGLKNYPVAISTGKIEQ